MECRETPALIPGAREPQSARELPSHYQPDAQAGAPVDRYNRQRLNERLNNSPPLISTLIVFQPV